MGHIETNWQKKKQKKKQDKCYREESPIGYHLQCSHRGARHCLTHQMQHYCLNAGRDFCVLSHLPIPFFPVTPQA